MFILVQELSSLLDKSNERILLLSPDGDGAREHFISLCCLIELDLISVTEEAINDLFQSSKTSIPVDVIRQILPLLSFYEKKSVIRNGTEKLSRSLKKIFTLRSMNLGSLSPFLKQNLNIIARLNQIVHVGE